MVPSALLAAQEGARGRPKCVSSILSFNLVLPLPGKIGSNLLDRDQFEPYASTEQQFLSPRAFPLNSLIIPNPSTEDKYFSSSLTLWTASVAPFSRGATKRDQIARPPQAIVQSTRHAKTDELEVFRYIPRYETLNAGDGPRFEVPQLWKA